MRSSLDVAIAIGVAAAVSAFLLAIMVLSARDAWRRFRGIDL